MVPNWSPKVGTQFKGDSARVLLFLISFIIRNENLHEFQNLKGGPAPWLYFRTRARAGAPPGCRVAKVLSSQELPKKWSWEKRCGPIQHMFFAQNFDAGLAGIVVWADGPYIDFCCAGALKSMNIEHIHRIHAPNSQFFCFKKKCACGRHINRPRSAWGTLQCMISEWVLNGIWVGSEWILNGFWTRNLLPIEPVACRSACL